MANLKSFEMIEDSGIITRGKYTLLNKPALPLKVLEVPERHSLK